MRTSAELREGFLSFFESKGHKRLPSWPLVPRPGGHLDAAHLRGDAAADAVLPRPRGAARAAHDHGAEVLPHARHRRGRARRPPPHVLRDARQLLVRPVLQAGRDRARDRVHPGPPEARVGARLGDRARRRSAARPRRGRGRGRALARGRHPARADRRPPEQRELLVGRRAGAVRARLGDLLRLGRGVRVRRSRLRARVPALRPLPRVLEPRLHGVRAQARRDADAAPAAERRHGHGPRAAGRDRAGGALPVGLRDRRLPGDHGLDRGGERRRLGRGRGGDEGAPRARRPRARDDLPRRRRRRALERGPRLRPPAHHPPRGPAGAEDRARRPVAPLRRRRRADGPVVSGARGEPGADPRRAPRGGGAVLGDACARDEALRRGRGQGRHLGRGRIHAHGDVRLPDRADRGARARARARGRRGRVQAAHGGAPRDLAGGRGEERAAAGRGLRARGRLRDRVRRLGEDRGAHADRRPRGPRRRHLPRQAAGIPLLSRRRRAGERPGLDRGRREARRARGRVPLRRGPGARLPRARGSPRASGSRPASPGRCASRRWPTTRRRTSCTRRFRRSSATTCARPARQCAPTSCASTSPTRRR